MAVLFRFDNVRMSWGDRNECLRQWAHFGDASNELKSTDHSPYSTKGLAENKKLKFQN